MGFCGLSALGYFFKNDVNMKKWKNIHCIENRGFDLMGWGKLILVIFSLTKIVKIYPSF